MLCLNILTSSAQKKTDFNVLSFGIVMDCGFRVWGLRAIMAHLSRFGSIIIIASLVLLPVHI